ncbi:MAG: tetratricopeptide repeat protein [Halanaerobiales bacterium]
MKEEKYMEQADEEIRDKYKEGQRLSGKGNYDQALTLYKEILEEKSEFVPAYNKIAILYIHKNELETAREWLQRALNIDREFPPAITNLGSIFKKEGNTTAARRYYQSAIDIDPEYGPAYNNLGVIAREQGNYTESVKFLKKARKYNSYTIDTSTDRPIYKEPGCIVIIGIIVLILLSIFFLIR